MNNQNIEHMFINMHRSIKTKRC